MKRMRILLVCVACTLVLTACQGKNVPAGSQPTSENTTVVTAVTETTTSETTTTTETTTTETTTTAAPSDAENRLSAAQLSEIETFLNQEENNGFVSNNFYTRPEDISLVEVFYCGAGIATRGTETWSEEEKADILALWTWNEFHINPLKFDRQKGDEFLRAKTGLSLKDFSGEIERYTYVEKYDAYYSSISDANTIRVELYDGYIDEDGLYTVFFEDPYLDDNIKVALRKVEGGYQFVSCMMADVTPGPMSAQQLTEIQTFLQEESSYGFVGPNTYPYSSGANLLYVFYDGAGLDVIPYTEWSPDELQDVLGTTDWNHQFIAPFKIMARDAIELLSKKCRADIRYMTNKPGEEFPYTPDEEAILYHWKYDAYYVMHGDGAYLYKAQVISGQWLPNGNCTVRYSDGSSQGKRYEVTLICADDGYYFSSNKEVP